MKLLVLVVGAGVSLLASAAEFPRVYVDTAYPTAPVAAAVAPVVLNVAEDCSDFQAQLDAAKLGDTVQLTTSSRCIGNYRLRNKTEGAGWIVIKTAGELKAGRVARSVPLPIILTPNANPAIATDPGAHHYRLVGLELGVVTERKAVVYSVLELGRAGKLADLPSYIVLDRVRIRGEWDQHIRRGVAMNGIHNAVIDSDIREIHQQGFDSQAVLALGPGPYKIVNNFLSASTENIMLGGGGVFCADAECTPTDVEITKNTLWKDPIWRKTHPEFRAPEWVFKAHFEIKNGRRVLFANNTMENQWPQAQPNAIIFQAARGDGAHAIVEDVTVTHNIVRNGSGGLTICARCSWSSKDDNRVRRISVTRNVFESMNLEGAYGARLFQISGGDDIEIVGNIAPTYNGWPVMLYPLSRGLVIRDNVFPFFHPLLVTDGAYNDTAIEKVALGSIFSANDLW
jgi:hypothetical protein